MSELIEEARRQVGHIHDKSRRERLIDDLADALESAEKRADDLEDRLSAYLCDSTGGMLSNTGYDVRTMVTYTEEYYQKVAEEDHASHCNRAESAEAKLAAVEALHRPDWSDWGIDHPEEGASCSCGANYSYEECPTRAALGLPVGGENEHD